MNEALNRGTLVRTTIALVTVAFIIRIAAIAAFGLNRIEFGDAADYLSAAVALCETGSYPDQSNLPFFRAPGLPVFAASLTLCHPANIGWVKIALAFVDSLTVALIIVLSLRILRSGTSAILAGAAATGYPLFIASVTDIRTEPLFMFFIVFSLLALRLAAESNRILWPALAGGVLALAALTRPVAIVFLPQFVAALVASAPRFGRARAARVLVLSFLVVMAPWTIRNFAHYGEFLPVNDADGYNLWRGTHPQMARIYGIQDRSEFRRASAEFEQQITLPTMQTINARASTPDQRSAAWRDAAFANVVSHPRLEAGFTLRKAFVYWRPWLNPQEFSAGVVGVTAVIFSALYVLAAWALIRVGVRDRAVVLWLGAFFILGWLAHLPFQVVARFRYPLTDPLLLIAAMHRVSEIMGRLIARRRHSRHRRLHAHAFVLPSLAILGRKKDILRSASHRMI